MAVRIRIPTPLRQMTNGAESVEVEGGDVNELLLALCAKFEGMDKRLFKQPGELNRFVNIYVNDEDIRFLGGEAYAFQDGDEIMLIPSIAGGKL